MLINQKEYDDKSDQALEKLFNGVPKGFQWAFLSVNQQWRRVALKVRQDQCKEELAEIFESMGKLLGNKDERILDCRERTWEILSEKAGSLFDYLEQTVSVRKTLCTSFQGIEEDKLLELGEEHSILRISYLLKKIEQKPEAATIVELIQHGYIGLSLESIPLLKDEHERLQCLDELYCKIQNKRDLNSVWGVTRIQNPSADLMKVIDKLKDWKEELWLFPFYTLCEPQLDAYLAENGNLKILKMQVRPKWFEPKWAVREIVPKMTFEEIDGALEILRENSVNAECYLIVIKRLIKLEMYERAFELFDQTVKDLSEKDRNVMTRKVHRALEKMKDVDRIFQFLERIGFDENHQVVHFYKYVSPIVDKYLEEKRFVTAAFVAEQAIFPERIRWRVIGQVCKEDDMDLFFDFLDKAGKPENYSVSFSSVVKKLIEQEQFLRAQYLVNFIEYGRDEYIKKIMNAIKDKNDIEMMHNFADAIKEPSERIDVYIFLAKYYVDQNNYDQAIEVINCIEEKKSGFGGESFFVDRKRIERREKRESFIIHFVDHLYIFGELTFPCSWIDKLKCRYLQSFLEGFAKTRLKYHEEYHLFCKYSEKYKESIDCLLKEQQYRTIFEKIARFPSCSSKKKAYYKYVIDYMHQNEDPEVIGQVISLIEDPTCQRYAKMRMNDT